MLRPVTGWVSEDRGVPNMHTSIFQPRVLYIHIHCLPPRVHVWRAVLPGCSAPAHQSWELLLWARLGCEHAHRVGAGSISTHRPGCST